METGMNQVPGGKVARDSTAEEMMREAQNSLNEGTFTELQRSYEETNRAVNELEQALSAARFRQAVYAAAIDHLNAPTNPQPSLR